MRFQVLGPVTAYGPDGPVGLGPARQRTVLAVLLVEPGAPVSLDQLMDRVWGERPPQRARGTLHAYLSRLRTVFDGAGGPVLVRRSSCYVLQVAPAAVDLHRFRALVGQARSAGDGEAARIWCDALDLWRGTPFADVDSDWLRAVATGLEGERLAAVLDRNEVLLRRGEYARLLPELSAAAAAYPLDERLAGQLMLALYACGRQVDAHAHYRSLRDRLIDESGSEPGPALRQLHERVLRHDPTLAAVAPAGSRDGGSPARSAGASGPPADRPAQLPADSPGFSGRGRSLAQLDELLAASGDASSTVVVTAIGGSAGVGKTALAVHWAHRVRDRFPDGQLYLNLRGFDPAGQVMSPAEALPRLLELLGVPAERIPTTVEARAGLYRSRLAGARMLVLLDNARDAEQVRPLLPGTPGVLVLVTSRDQLAGLVASDGAQPVRLDALDASEARQLLAGRLGAARVAAESAAVDGIVAACAGLPLALAIVAARAATNPGFPLSVFAGELADARGRLDALAGPDAATDLRAVFSGSYEALSPPAARLYRLLGLHPGPDLGLAAAASLAGLTAARTRRQLAELIAAHLIIEHTPGRYAFHDLVRVYAAELAGGVDTEPERRAALERMLDYYLHSAHAADRWLPASQHHPVLDLPQPEVVPEAFSGNAAARAWLTIEFPVLLAVLDQNAEAGFDHHIHHLTRALSTYLLWRGLWHHQVTVQAIGLRAASRCADAFGQAEIHRRVAVACALLGRRDDAHSHAQRALAIYREIGDHAGEARGHMTLAWLSTREDRYQDGLAHAEGCLDAAHAGNSQLMRALAHNAIGWCHTRLGNHALAITHGEQAIAEMTEIGDAASMADVWDTLAHAHRGLGQYQRAIDCYQQAIDWNRRFGGGINEANRLTRLGEVHETVGDIEAARQSWQQALEIFADVGHPEAGNLRKRLA
ncbi:AfsR/SARP family transcriptional regulator [Micromonospora sp. CPCC 206061]|uniref:AfsR/SARP family transcriptional regulator n=1 Tax=Micromonospora sp. CPCC 206061 TaxID=3122410 RepID=UPI002FF1060C